jgi:hypothetical protein
MAQHPRVDEAIAILAELGMPRAQLNSRSALTLLALLNLTPDKVWSQAEAPLIGITPIMEFARQHYAANYKPNTRETFRRQTMHQFVAAGIALYNPDNHLRPVNSPKAVYQIESTALDLLRAYNAADWSARLNQYLAIRKTLVERYAKRRQQQRIAVVVAPGQQLQLSPGEHSKLLKAIVEEFAPRFVPGSQLVYLGDTGEKWGYYDQTLLLNLGVTVDVHGKMPDVVLYEPAKNWLILVEAVTSHGPVDAKRHDELLKLFANARAGLIYVTAFPSRRAMKRHLADIAWETEVWVADAPSHLIHFNGERFLGPYADPR